MILHGRDAVVRSLDEVAACLDGPVDDYMIGGGALAIRGLKDATKDIDHVVATDADYSALRRALVKAKYKQVPSTELTEPYPALAARGVYVKPGRPQWDVFVGVVAKKLRLSPGMIARSDPPDAERQNLRVRLLANDDILVFKAVAGRVGDAEDMERIILARPDWDAILDEMRWQCRHSDTAWSSMFYEAMAGLAQRYRIPILEELADLADQDVGEKLVLFYLGERTLTRQDLYTKIKEDPEWIDSCISALLKQRRIMETEEGLRKVAQGPFMEP